MSMMTNMVIFMLTFTFLAWMLGYPPMFVTMLSCMQGVSTSNFTLVTNSTVNEHPTAQNQTYHGCATDFTFFGQAYSSITIGTTVGAVLLATSTIFPNTLAAGALVALALLGISMSPYTMFTTMGFTGELFFIPLFLGGVYFMVWLLIILSWWRGG